MCHDLNALMRLNRLYFSMAVVQCNCLMRIMSIRSRMK
jgi:hypothetical protein